MNTWLVFGILTLYMGILFWCAFYGDRYTKRIPPQYHLFMFSLTLAVYCSSWTFFGSTGVAVRQGVGYLPLYLGPLLFLWLGYDVWRRIGKIREHHAISSIADFISARYGKSGYLAALVTLLAVIAVIPYLALQIRAIALSTAVVFPQNDTSDLTTHTVLILIAVLTVVSIIFGTRQMDNTEQHGGLMLAVALESLLKLFALVIIALFFILHEPNSIGQIFSDTQEQIKELQNFGFPQTFWIQTLLAGLAMICLPRQFHVAVVELTQEKQIRGARRWFSLYLILTAVAIIPIISWALHTHSNLIFSPDVAVLTLPLSYGYTALGALAFLGGFSASTGMLLISSIALSIMLSNDLIMPTLWKLKLISRHDKRLPFILRTIRQVCICLVMALGFLFFYFFNDIDYLSVFGLLAFSAVAQFSPALIGGLYWRGGSKQGVYAGLIIGFLLWSYTLLLPTIIRSLPPEYTLAGQELLYHGLFHIYALRPESLLGFESLAPLTHGVCWSLGINILCYVWFSKLYRPSVAEQIQAERFFYYDAPILTTQNTNTEQNYFFNIEGPRLKISDLMTLSQRITGTKATERAFKQFCEQNYLMLQPNQIANGMWWRFTEQYLASTIGAASARTLLKTALVNNGLGLAQVANILDQASQWQRFNKNLLMTMIDHMAQGVSVVDANMCLVAWNNQYLKLFGYPKDLVYVGCPIADLIRYNAERGECGPGSIEEHVHKRLEWMKAGNAHEFERIRKDGRVIQMRGNPIEGGGFVTTFADITAFRENEAILEARVNERTHQLKNALLEQRVAREQADTANMSKSRFIAAASHDLLQPMHAARLFSTALEQSIEQDDDKKTLQQLDRALYGAESMLSSLLDIAKLEGGSIQPKRLAYPLHDLLSDLQLQFKSIAAQRQIHFKVHDAQFWIDTDPQWIRRIIQNFVSNALRYTATGKIIVGVLRSATRENYIRIGIWDTGPGIPDNQKNKLFQEFERCGHTSPWGEQGLGLGLAIVKRMTHLLDYPLHVYSKQGKGACFMIEVPKVQAPHVPVQHTSLVMMTTKQYKILCLDNDDAILDGMKTLLKKWGHDTFIAREPEEALKILEQESIDVWMIDQHLNQQKQGLYFIQKYRQPHVPIALITADSDPELPQKLKQLNIMLLRKPLKPASMRSWLAGLKLHNK